MIKILPRNIIRFVALVLVQVLIFNNIEINGYFVPYVYILFIILLPFETPRWLLLVLGFIFGFSIDIFSETMGLHTSATVLMAYIRPYILTIIAPRDGYETGTYPRVIYYGLGWFVKYTAILVFTHHALLFLLEFFRFQDIFGILLRIILSSIFTIFLISISQYFVFRK